MAAARGDNSVDQVDRAEALHGNFDACTDTCLDAPYNTQLILLDNQRRLRHERGERIVQACLSRKTRAAVILTLVLGTGYAVNPLQALPDWTLTTALVALPSNWVLAKDTDYFQMIRDPLFGSVTLDAGGVWTNDISLTSRYGKDWTAAIRKNDLLLLWSYALRTDQGPSWKRISGAIPLPKQP